MMRKSIAFTGLALLLFAGVSAQPATEPTEFHGNVSYEDGSVLDSGTVKAVVNGEIKAQTAFSGGTYEIIVERNSSSSWETISFYVGNTDTGEDGSFETFRSQRLDLTVPAPEDSGTTGGSSGGTSTSSSGGGGGFSLEDNEEPVAGFTWDTPVRPGEEVILNASGSFDPDGSIEQYRWSIGDTGPEAATVFGETGEHTVTLTVVDDSGAEANVTKQVSVSRNQAPVARFGVLYSQPNILQNVRFNASESYDPDGSIEHYEWSFGDTGIEAVQSFDEPEAVSLTVIDNEGKNATVTEQLNSPEDESGDTTGPTGMFAGDAPGFLQDLLDLLASLFSF
ncbi:MAG: PKD domain-containing protein [Candidatus Nanohaloarchaea archaeon]